MFKKTAVILASCFLIIALYFYLNTPIFKDYANTYEVYLESYSSSDDIVKVTCDNFSLLQSIKGLSFKTDKDNFSIAEFLEDFGAEIKFTESVKEGTSYYCYSGKIKYREMVKGKIINLHVFIGSEQVTVGAPLIYGSF